MAIGIISFLRYVGQTTQLSETNHEVGTHSTQFSLTNRTTEKGNAISSDIFLRKSQSEMQSNENHKKIQNSILRQHT